MAAAFEKKRGSTDGAQASQSRGPARDASQRHDQIACVCEFLVSLLLPNRWRG